MITYCINYLIKLLTNTLVCTACLEKVAMTDSFSPASKSPSKKISTNLSVGQLRTGIDYPWQLELERKLEKFSKS